MSKLDIGDLISVDNKKIECVLEICSSIHMYSLTGLLEMPYACIHCTVKMR